MTSWVIRWATSRFPVRTAMSSSVTMPASRSSSDHRQPADPVLDHQRRRLLELHLRLAGDQRPRGAARSIGVSEPASSASTRIARSRSVTIAAGTPSGSTMTTEPTRVVAHQLGHLEGARARLGGDHGGGHDLAQLHRPVPYRPARDGGGARVGSGHGRLPANRGRSPSTARPATPAGWSATSCARRGADFIARRAQPGQARGALARSRAACRPAPWRPATPPACGSCWSPARR